MAGLIVLSCVTVGGLGLEAQEVCHHAARCMLTIGDGKVKC